MSHSFQTIFIAPPESTESRYFAHCECGEWSKMGESGAMDHDLALAFVEHIRSLGRDTEGSPLVQYEPMEFGSVLESTGPPALTPEELMEWAEVVASILRKTRDE